MTKTVSRLLVATMVVAGVVGTSARADAAFLSYICDDILCTGGGDTFVVDQGPGDNFPGSALLGQINSGALNVAGFTIVTNVSQTRPLIGSASAPQLDLTFSAVTSDNNSHTVYLYASDTGFTGAGAFSLTLGGTQPAPGAGNSITAGAWGGNSNTNLNLSNALATVTSTGTPFALSASGVVSPLLNPYGLTIGVAITRTAAGTTTGDLHLQVPEPASMMLFGLGLVGFAAKRRQRAKQTA